MRVAKAILHTGVSNNTGIFDGITTRENYAEIKVGIDLIIISGFVRLFNRDDIIARVGTEFANDATDAFIVLCAYLELGEACVRYMNGEFAFIIYDGRQHSVFGARDHLGMATFYYAVESNLVIFANRIQEVASSLSQVKVDEMWVVDLLERRHMFKDRTVYKEVYRLEPGHMLTKKRNSSIEVTQYWQLGETSKNSFNTYDEAIEEFSFLFSKAVKSRIDKDYGTGVELSGGLDSSGIAAFAQPYLQESCRSLVAFSNVLPKEYKDFFPGFTDEWEKACEVSTQLGIAPHIPVSEPIKNIEELKSVLQITGYPINFFLSVAQRGIYQAANAVDVRTLFSGLGGNELITEQAISRYIYTLAKNGQIVALANFFRKNDNEGWLKSYTKAAYRYGLYLTNNERRDRDKSLNTFLSYSVLNDSLVDLSVKMDHNLYAPVGQSLKERSLFRVSYGGFVDRLETDHLITNAYKIHYAYPMLDVQLMEFYFSLPDEWKARGKYGRTIFRDALNGRLSGDIVYQMKPSNTTAVPFHRVEIEENFECFKEWCMSLPVHHKVFDYVNRDKLRTYSYDTKKMYKQQYKTLKMVAMLSMFLDTFRS